MKRRWPALIALVTVALAAPRPVHGCTAFCASTKDGHVLVGNNEDYSNPRTKIWFIPAENGAYGRMYVGFDDMWPQGGMNERGLWFDGFSAPPVRASSSADLPSYPGNIVDAALSRCATVDCVVQLFTGYNRALLTQAILRFADATGDAVSIEANAIVRKKGRHFVQTNFHQSRGGDGWGEQRFKTATQMLAEAGDAISSDLFRRILAATHQEGGGPTLYSNVYDLQSRTMQLYYFHDFERAVTFDLAEELKKGRHVLDIPSLFPRNASAEAFASRAATGGSQGIPRTVAVLAIGTTLLLATGVVALVVRGGRRGRVVVGVGAALVVLLVGMTAFFVGGHGARSPAWIEFSILPATGESLSINDTTFRGDGATLKNLIATAFEFPAVRVIGPEWLAQTRFGVRAMVGVDDASRFHPLLQEELKRHLALETHVELRPFDVYVMRIGAAGGLKRASEDGTSIMLGKDNARIQSASPAQLAGAMQTLIGRPVIDETGLSGLYNLDLEWKQGSPESLKAVLRERSGLELVPATVNLEALVIDKVRLGRDLMFLTQAARLTSVAPAYMREQIARALIVN
jgi:uncharacterized protein (TIGR03435 family)